MSKKHQFYSSKKSTRSAQGRKARHKLSQILTQVVGQTARKPARKAAVKPAHLVAPAKTTELSRLIQDICC